MLIGIKKKQPYEPRPSLFMAVKRKRKEPFFFCRITIFINHSNTEKYDRF